MPRCKRTRRSSRSDEDPDAPTARASCRPPREEGPGGVDTGAAGSRGMDDWPGAGPIWGQCDSTPRFASGPSGRSREGEAHSMSLPTATMRLNYRSSSTP
jgi:hypothetical protein